MAKIEVRLPKKPTPPGGTLDDFSALFHGEKKIGKTSLVNQGGKVLFLQCDPPQKAYTRYEIHCPNWATIKAAIRKIQAADAKGKLLYRRIVLDGVGTAYKRCQRWTCEKLAIDHPNDEAWGKGWDALRTEFTQAVDSLLALSVGCWFICHSTTREVKLRNGRTKDKMVPALTPTCEEVLNGLVDGWFAYDYEGDQRILVVRGDEQIGAGHRMDEEDNPHFRTPEGKRVRWVPMGNSPREAYENLVKAFDNKQLQSSPGRLKKKKRSKKRN